jgi:glycosyltransferase involved in cell wall biosynthesis
MGSGTRLKILEAMAAGCAVVATSFAASGLDGEARRAMLISDDENEFASAILSLLRDPARRQSLGKAAQRYVRQHYDWSALIPDLLAAYKAIGLG